MANYFIIGGDQKEYGPITAEDIQLWIAEGRLNAHSSARSETETNWRPLGSFAEFAAAFRTAPPTIAPPDNSAGAHNAAMEAIKVPAICLKIIAALGFVLSLWSLFRLVFFQKQVQEEISRAVSQYPQLQDAGFQKMLMALYGPVGMASNAFAMVISAVIFAGAMRMQKLRSFEFSFVVAILALLPCATNCCAWVFGLPVGIWTLIVLNKKEVKSQFK
jgi:hypothetical protein